MQKDVILCILNVQESFDPGRPRAHARKKALEFSGCHVWVSITLRPSFPAGTARSQLPMGIRRARHALPKAGHFCTVCKHFCICRRTTKDTCIWRSFLLSFVGEDARIPENVKHSEATVSGKDCRCSVQTWALLCRAGLLYWAVIQPLLTSLYQSSCLWSYWCGCKYERSIRSGGKTK